MSVEYGSNGESFSDVIRSIILAILGIPQILKIGEDAVQAATVGKMDH